ncbi:MAG: acyltransferase domain-containing protein, partial [Nostoc sp.]
PLHTSHAFHSQMMDSILLPFQEQVRKISLNSPKIPFVSNVTGTWITPAQATDPKYWVKHLRQTVRFSEGIAELLQQSKRILLEVGPGRTLSTLANKQKAAQQVVL